MRRWQGNITISILIILAWISMPVEAQNLVPNCSFEDYISCPNNSGQMNFCREWYSPGEGTPDYCNQCNQGNYGIPNNQWGSQFARDERAYAHIINYYPSQSQYREYIQVKLSAPLRNDEEYKVSFYVSCADESKYAADGLGLHLTVEPLIQPGDKVINLPGDPHICNTPGMIIDEKEDWLLISGSYVAQGGERYLTIGNFLSDNALNVNYFAGPGLEIASYYIDQVSVEPMETWLELGPDTVLCPGEVFYLDATIPGNATYEWGDGSQEPVYEVSEPGTYRVEVNFGCWPISDQIEVDYYENPSPFLANDTALCPGKEIILDAGEQFETYLWQDGSTDQTYTVSQDGNYWVEAGSSAGCIFHDTVIILSIDVPGFALGDDTVLCLGQSLGLAPEVEGPYLEYLWSDMSREQQLQVIDSGYYWLKVSNPCGSYTDTIHIEGINCSAELFVPNAFTPNGDLINDIFLPKGQNINKYRLIIYDRWGSEIFESDSLEEGWDGTNAGEPCPTGVYVWIIVYESASEYQNPKVETLKGSCVLLE